MPITTGLELTSDSLKFVAAESRGKKREIRAWGRIPISESSDLGQALDQLQTQFHLPLERLRLAVGTQSTQLRVHAFPPMPRSELAFLAQGEIEKELEMAAGEMLTGWQLLTEAKKAERMSVLIAITPRQALVDARAALESRGVYPELVTTSSLALFGHVRNRTDLSSASGCFGLLHIGLERMVLALMEGGGFRLLRDLGVGMDASLLGGAEAGLGGELDELDSWSRGLDAMNMVAHQIKRTFDYDARQHPDRPVSRLLLAGDAARAAALAPLLANELGLSVELLDPLAGDEWGGIDGTLSKEAAAFALPLALVSRAGANSILDLLPRARRSSATHWTGAWITASALLTAVSVAAIPVDLKLDQMRAQREALKENQAVLPAKHGPASDTRAWEAQARLNPVPVDPLLWLGTHLPPEGRLESIDLARESSGWRVSWTGTVKSSDTDRRLAAWAEFQTALEGASGVSEIDFVAGEGEADGWDGSVSIDGSFHLEAKR